MGGESRRSLPCVEVKVWHRYEAVTLDMKDASGLPARIGGYEEGELRSWRLSGTWPAPDDRRILPFDGWLQGSWKEAVGRVLYVVLFELPGYRVFHSHESFAKELVVDGGDLAG